MKENSVGGAWRKRKGAKFERDVKKWLQSKGYFVARQPRSAFPDLIAISSISGKVYFIECKMNKYISGVEKRNLEKLSSVYNAVSLIAYTGGDRIFRFCNLSYVEVFVL